MKCVIIGNSVALRVRPKEPTSSLVYGTILENSKLDNGEKIEVKNFGMSRLLVTEAFRNKDVYIREFPDVFIINLGCVDAPLRDIPLWMSDILFFRKKSRLFKFLNTLYLYFIKRYSNIFVHLRFHTPWVRKKKFKSYFRKLISEIIKETNANIILLGINSGNKLMDNKLPNTQKRYRIYNSIIENIALEFKLNHINVSDLNSSSHYPDGVHYNLAGHTIIANRILHYLNTL